MMAKICILFFDFRFAIFHHLSLTFQQKQQHQQNAKPCAHKLLFSLANNWVCPRWQLATNCVNQSNSFPLAPRGPSRTEPQTANADCSPSCKTATAAAIDWKSSLLFGWAQTKYSPILAAKPWTREPTANRLDVFSMAWIKMFWSETILKATRSCGEWRVGKFYLPAKSEFKSKSCPFEPGFVTFTPILNTECLLISAAYIMLTEEN